MTTDINSPKLSFVNSFIMAIQSTGQNLVNELALRPIGGTSQAAYNNLLLE